MMMLIVECKEKAVHSALRDALPVEQSAISNFIDVVIILYVFKNVNLGK